MSKEAKVAGSVAWFAGVWWLAVGVTAHQAALGLVRLRAPASWVLAAAELSSWALGLAARCAREAGAED